MEEKKNNAVEKAERILSGKEGENPERAERAKTAPKKSSRAKEREKKRLAAARKKAHRLAEKQKAKAAAIREKNRRKAELKQRKAAVKAEKERRRDMLKNETEKQREARITEEKAAKARYREQKAENREKERRRKMQLKAAKAERRDKNRQKRKERNRGTGGWLAAVISLGVCSLVLASVLTFTFLMPTESDNMLETSYRRSFYDTVEQVNNMDLNLSKVLASKDGVAQQTYLVDLAVNSELAENDIQQLPLKDESKYYTTKTINQIGDYAKYLGKKLAEGQELSDEDRQNLTMLYKVNAEIKAALDRMTEGMGPDYSFSALSEGSAGDIVISNFSDLENLSVEYPELIYDGPFSDGQDRIEAKGLGTGTITERQAEEMFIKLFADYSPANVRAEGYTEGVIRCINVYGETDGEQMLAQFSETGGKLIMFSYAGRCESVEYDGDTAAEKALSFLSAMGIEGMKPVWINLANNVYTINIAAEQDGVIIYSDLIKVRVCARTANVIGVEAAGYFINHTERVIAKPALTVKQAKAKVFSGIDVITSRLAVIPVGENSEKLCYEFSGTYDGSTYYVYIDAATGRQVEMFKVIKSTEGELLM